MHTHRAAVTAWPCAFENPFVQQNLDNQDEENEARKQHFLVTRLQSRLKKHRVPFQKWNAVAITRLFAWAHIDTVFNDKKRKTARDHLVDVCHTVHESQFTGSDVQELEQDGLQLLGASKEQAVRLDDTVRAAQEFYNDKSPVDTVQQMLLDTLVQPKVTEIE